MTVKINLQRAARKVAPEDDYICLVDVCQEGVSKANDPKLHLEYLIDPDTHPEYAGVRIWSDMSLKEKSWFRIVELAGAVLGELQPENEEGDFEFEPSDFEGQKVAAHISIDEEYDGTPRNKVDFVYNVEDFGAEPEEEESTEE